MVGAHKKKTNKIPRRGSSYFSLRYLSTSDAMVSAVTGTGCVPEVVGSATWITGGTSWSRTSGLAELSRARVQASLTCIVSARNVYTSV